MNAYKIKSQIQNQGNKGYIRHECVLIDLKYLNKINDNNNNNIHNNNEMYISFVLFGGMGNIPFQSNMIEFGVTLLLNQILV